MKRKTRSILEELSSVGKSRDVVNLIETRGANLIESATNLLDLVRQHFNEDEALEIERRFLGAIRTADARKFQRGVKRIIEARNTPDNGDFSKSD